MAAINTLEEMLAGKDVFINKAFIDQTVVHVKPGEEREEGRRKRGRGQRTLRRNTRSRFPTSFSTTAMSRHGKRSWKAITTTFPNLKVYIFHGGELVNDINSLFKWGKVKHGDSIFFQVAGDNIKGVSKLQKYLYEGASPRFEQFLKIGVGQVLSLF